MARVEIGEVVLKAVPALAIVAGASVQVNHRSGGAATIYQAEIGTSTRSNPLSTDSAGRIEGWVAPGSYDLVVSGSGITTYTQAFEAPPSAAEMAVNALDHGIDLTGATDSTAALEAAIEEADARGGGDVLIPKAGTLLLNGPGGVPHTGGDISWAVGVPYDNVRIVAVPGVVYKTTVNCATFAVIGSGKVAGMESWGSYRFQTPATTTVYDLDGPIEAGAVAITLTTVGEASNFAAGDWVYVRSGQLAATGDAQDNPSAPDGEINQIKSIASGVLTLRFPLTKRFRQEYFANGGSSGPTTGAVTAFPCPFGVQNVTDRLIQGFAMKGGRFLHTGNGASSITTALWFDGIYGLDLALDPGSKLSGHLMVRNNVRRFHDDHLQAHFTSEAAAFTYHSFCSADTGCGDGHIDHCSASSESGVAILELHEGNSMVHVDHPVLLNPSGSTSTVPAISIDPRSYGLRITKPTLVNGTTVIPTIKVYDVVADYQNNAFGRIDDPALFGTFPAGGIDIGAPDWLLRGEQVPDGVSVRYLHLDNHQAPQVPQVLSALVDYDAADTLIGTIPAGSVVRLPTMEVYVVFNAGITAALSVGVPGGGGFANAFCQPEDVKGATPATPLVLTPGGYTDITAQNELEVHAYLITEGAAPTTGRALVTIEYVRVVSQ